MTGLSVQFSIGHESPRSPSENEFQQLVDLREEMPDRIIAAEKQVGFWVTLASKDRKILSPYEDFNSSLLDERNFYHLNLEER